MIFLLLHVVNAYKHTLLTVKLHVSDCPHTEWRVETLRSHWNFLVFIYILMSRKTPKIGWSIKKRRNSRGWLRDPHVRLSFLWTSLKDPVPWSCSVKVVLTKADRITKAALNSLSSLQYKPETPNMKLNIYSFTLTEASLGSLPWSEADLDGTGLLGSKKPKAWCHSEHIRVIWFCTQLHK